MSGRSAIFTKTVQEWAADPRFRGSSFSQVKVCNGRMVAVVNGSKLISQSVVSSTSPVEIPLPTTGDKIHNIFLSPSATCLLIGTKNGEILFANLKNSSVFHVRRIKQTVTAVGWNPEYPDTETGPILLGTSSGAIYETNIGNNGSVTYFKEHVSVFSGERDRPAQISDIRLFLQNDIDVKATRWAMVVCQPGRLTTITATIDLSPPARSGYLSSAGLKAGYIAVPESQPHLFHPFFNEKDNRTRCSFIGMSGLDTSSEPSSLTFHPYVGEPQRFLWLDPVGICVGRVNLEGDDVRDILIEENQIERRRVEGELDHPISATLSEYHILLAYSTRLVALSFYTYLPVFEDAISQNGVVLGITSDTSSEIHWLYTSSSCIKYKPHDETRYIWRYFLDREDYVKAFAIANSRRNIDPDAFELILKRQADKFFKEKNFTGAAEVLAQSTDPFESVVLKMMHPDDKRKLGLKALLEKKLEKFSRPDDKVKRDTIVLWLLEIHLSEMAEVRRDSARSKELSELWDHLRRFIARKLVHESLLKNKEAVYNLAVSHADFDFQFFVAGLLNDTEMAIRIHFLRQEYAKMLDLIVEQGSSDLLSMYAAQLVEHIPKKVFDAARKQKIRPNRMFTAICACQNDSPLARDAISYMYWLLSTPFAMHDVTTHNLLVSFLAQHRPDEVLPYLKDHGTDEAAVPYDYGFVMRTCQQFALVPCIVFLYCVGGMMIEAVNLALKEGDVELAKECARSMSTDDDDFLFGVNSKFSNDQLRKVWLKIARYVIEKDANARTCMSLLKESKDVISIQDLLPYFPEFTKIEYFKEPLSEYLKDHSSKIKQLQQAMKDATQIAQEIREKIERLRNRVVIVKAGDVCAACTRPLSVSPFYVHSCRHFFHRECLESTIKPLLDEAMLKRLHELVIDEERLVAQFELSERAGNKYPNVDREARYERIMTEIDDILGFECPYCGIRAVNLIDKPFFTDEELAMDELSWNVM